MTASTDMQTMSLRRRLTRSFTRRDEEHGVHSDGAWLHEIPTNHFLRATGSIDAETGSSADMDTATVVYLRYLHNNVVKQLKGMGALWVGVTSGHFVPPKLAFMAIIRISDFLTAQEDSPSLNTLVDHLVAEKIFAEAENDQDQQRQATFVIQSIAWLTMLFEPIGIRRQGTQSTKGSLYIVPPDVSLACLEHPDYPLMQSLRTLDVLTIGTTIKSEALISSADDTLLASNLNLDSICCIAKIQIDWTYNIDQHLRLNADQSRLKVFAFPSFCATYNTRASCFARFSTLLQDELQLRSSQSATTGSSVTREVLSSFQLLFNTSKARQHFLAKEHRQIVSQYGDDADPHLLTICESSALHEKASKVGYSKSIEFPLLADRLGALHTIVDNYRPTSGRALLRDRRNILNWYTLWAVIALGLAGILLAIIQLPFTIAQAVYAYKAYQQQLDSAPA